MKNQEVVGDTNKRFGIFILLKVIEIGLVVFIPFILGKYLNPIILNNNYNKFLTWLYGWFYLLPSLLILIAGIYLIYGLFSVVIMPYIRMNWNWAGKLETKLSGWMRR